MNQQPVTNDSHSFSINGTVTFGNRPQGSNICVGRGICKPLNQSDPEAVHATFQLVSGNPGMLQIILSLAELTQKQPAQVPYFTSGSYHFDVNYPLTDPAFAQLNLLPNPIVLTTSDSRVQIVGDVVTTSITYSHG